MEKEKNLKDYQKALKYYKEKRENALNGNVNCIPSPFKRFRKHFPGVEQAMNYIVTANSKIGKTQLADFLFVLSPIFYAYHNPDKVRIHIEYASLEMSVQVKIAQWDCHWLYLHTKGKVRISPKDLRSLNEENPLSLDILELLESEEHTKFFDFLEECIHFIEDRNPYGIYKNCVEYAMKHGEFSTKMLTFVNKEEYENETGDIMVKDVIEQKEVRDKYIPYDPKLYKIKVVDHVGLYQTEKGMNLRDTIGKASSQDNVILRNKYGFTCVDIQQQASDKEGLDSFMADRLYPTPDGLGENKTTQRDCNIMIGLFAPHRYKKQKWEGYDITKFEDNIRFLEICLNRDGNSGMICPLYFDGAVSFFAELPLPDKEKELQVYKQMALRAQNNK